MGLLRKSSRLSRRLPLESAARPSPLSSQRLEPTISSSRSRIVPSSMISRPSIYASPRPSRGFLMMSKATLRSVNRTVRCFPPPDPNVSGRLPGRSRVMLPLVKSLSTSLPISDMDAPLRNRRAFSLFLCRRLQLSASRVDVAAARRAYGCRNARLEDDVAEGADALVGRAFVPRSQPRIERDQVHLCRKLVLADQPHELARVLRTVVLVLEHHIFEGDAPRIVRAGVSRAGFEQLLDPVFPIERHDLVTDLFGHGVKRHCEIDPDLFAGARHHRHDARSRKGNPSPRQSEAVAVHDDLQRIPHIFEIVERLAHAHHYDI